MYTLDRQEGEIRYGKTALGRARIILCAGFLLATLCGCSVVDKIQEWTKPLGGSSGGSMSAPPPTQVSAAGGTSVSAVPTPMDTFRALSPPEGLRFTPLFSMPASSDEERMARLEGAVQQMRNDFDTVVPALVRMVAIEKDMKGLIAELRTLTGDTSPPEDVTQQPPVVLQPLNPPASPVAAAASMPAAMAGPPPVQTEEPPIDWSSPQGRPVPSEPAPDAGMKVEPSLKMQEPADPMAPIPIAPQPQPEPVVAQPQTPPAQIPQAPPVAAAPAANATIKAVRISDYPEKTRLVIDMTSNILASPHIENNGKTLVIDLGPMTWTAPKSWDADTAELISGYHLDKNALYIDLMYPSQIMKHEVLPAIPENPNVRLMIDLFSAEVHQKSVP